MVKDALLALANIEATGKKYIDQIVATGGTKGSIVRLVELLESKDDVCVESSLEILSIAGNKHLAKAVEAGLLSCVVRIILSNRWETLMLPPPFGKFRVIASSY